MRMFRLTVVTLLAAACCTLTDGAISITCEGSDALLQCDGGKIQIKRANYGRRQHDVCSIGRPDNQLTDTNCLSQSTTSKMAERCGGKSECVVPASNFVFGDPCVGTYKYLDIKYSCVQQQETISSIICEGSDSQLLCDRGEIHIQRANYGRRQHDVCSIGRPHKQLKNTNCLSPSTTSTMAKRCDGERQCIIKVSNSVFGDPCVGTYKYLDVAYTLNFDYMSNIPIHVDIPCIFSVPTTPVPGIMCMFRLMVVTLLAAACCTLTDGAISITCEGSDALLQCDGGKIQIKRANYGRRQHDVCSIGRPDNQLTDTNCLSQSTSKMAERCGGKSECVVPASNFVFGDPCVGTYKYLDIKYSCVQQQETISSIICEGSDSQLLCDRGEIHIQRANYGRRQHDVCSIGRPHKQLKNTNCLSPSTTSTMAKRCDGERQCIIKVSNSVFGDPCVGTYKYLDVAYTCY
ncbi:rhamnose-binding lectin-like [Salvelinus namaycush]|uniref:Rhamnose-binding lectin-like n=2 Tax=Salvelinus namaycush TaxID=8040 RepID=A0A8U1F888_SALNM|nr:rhamnose-binding lectin-like [Salvelinus namaycush]